MENNYDEYFWEKLDNAALIYPATTTSKSSNVYRISFKLTEDVSPALLQIALEKALDELPAFCVKMRKGIFWYYFEHNFVPPRLSEDDSFPCTVLDKLRNNGYLFRLTYFHKMVNLEVYHVLTDGYGAVFFLKTILLYYFQLCYPDKVSTDLRIESDDLTRGEMIADSFLANFQASKKGTSPTKVKAFAIKGTHLRRKELKVITGIVSTKELLTAARARKTTATAFLAALLIYAIYKESYRLRTPKNQPIQLSIPVNLRGYFESGSIRNFFSVLSTGINFYETAYTLDEIITKVNENFNKLLDRDLLVAKMSFSVRPQQNMALRLAPIFLKDLILRLVYRYNETSLTSTVTNLGKITVPEEMQPFIERVTCAIWTTPVQPKKLSLASFGDDFTMTFTSSLEETSIEQRFFKTLIAEGLTVKISSNSEDTPDASKEAKG